MCGNYSRAETIWGSTVIILNLKSVSHALIKLNLFWAYDPVIELELTQPNQYHSSVCYFLVYTTTARKQKTIWGQLVSTEACSRLSIFLMWLALLLGCSMVDFQTKGMKFCDHKVMLETFITMAHYFKVNMVVELLAL